MTPNPLCAPAPWLVSFLPDGAPLAAIDGFLLEPCPPEVALRLTLANRPPGWAGTIAITPADFQGHLDVSPGGHPHP